MKRFSPLMMNSSPSRTAVVFIPAVSEPTSGSVMPMAPIFSPVTIGGRYLPFCLSLPNL